MLFGTVNISEWNNRIDLFLNKKEVKFSKKVQFLKKSGNAVYKIVKEG